MYAQLPLPLLKLISSYLTEYCDSDFISTLITYNDNKILDANIVLYIIENYQFCKQLKPYITRNVYELLTIIMTNYSSHRKIILDNLYPYITERIMNKYYRIYDSSLKLYDVVIINACIQHNEIFLNDFIDIFDIKKSLFAVHSGYNTIEDEMTDEIFYTINMTSVIAILNLYHKDVAPNFVAKYFNLDYNSWLY